MRKRGFTLIELLVVMTIIGMLLAVAVPRYFHSLEHSRETVLRHDLSVLRDAIDKYAADTGHYPQQLADLVTAKYVRALPVDPYTKTAAAWIGVPSDDATDPGIKDVHSGAQGTATDGSGYATW
jgi:general secretion pathway protein G